MWVNPYFGKPGAMVALPAPDTGTAPPNRGDNAVTNLSGGTVVTRRLHVKRRYELGYSDLPAADSDLLLEFWNGSRGTGPWVYVDPTAQNVLGLDVAACGLRAQADHGWSASAGTLTRGATPPAGLNSGVLTWAGLAAAAILQPTFATTSAPVTVPGEPMTLSVWMQASAAVNVTLRPVAYDTAGVATLPGSPLTTANVTTTWQPFAVTVPAGSSAAMILPRIVLPGSGLPASLSVAAAQVEYNTTRSGWRRGQGSPRVVITESPGYETGIFGYATHRLTLAQV